MEKCFYKQVTLLLLCEYIVLMNEFQVKDVLRMASIYGNIEIQQITGGTVNFGNAHSVSPKAAVKDPSGGGSKNQGGYVFTSTGISVVNFFDPDCNDQQLDADCSGNNNGSTETTGTTGTTGSTSG